MKTKTFQTILFILFISTFTYSQTASDTIFVASWNMENLFDTIDDADKNDADFLPEGKKEWTQDKIDQKIKNQAKVIQWMNDGKGPDLLVEKPF
jgi:Skp family chaperone for outer membrane proteins